METEAASQAQLLRRPQRRIRPADPVDSSSRIQWLGIGSWALFCAALFVSLLLRPDQDAVDRGIGLQADHTLQRAIESVPATADAMPLRSNGRGITIRFIGSSPLRDWRAWHDRGVRSGLVGGASGSQLAIVTESKLTRLATGA